MSEETFPQNFRWELVEEKGIKGIRRKIIAIKEPGPGCVGLFWCIPPLPNFFLAPCFLYSATAVNMTFIKRKNDHVDLDYRQKNLCFEKRLLMTDVTKATVESYVKRKETVYILCIKHSGGIFEFQDIALANERWKKNVDLLCDRINYLVSSRPF